MAFLKSARQAATSSTSTSNGTGCTSSSRARRPPPTCSSGAGTCPASPPRISGAGLAGLQVIRGYNQELAQTIYAAALAADFDAGNLLERLGSSAMDLLTSLVRSGHPQGTP